ncbi:low affinity vacuolar monovalent cation/H(+) antiporter-like [Stegastes partitus]|uniref:Low affinity vacuolar monovalent cation/H(+) antiporter-like n=1 Tax=Stegastes partitus TaxID=144197 RepID=A0A9Y4TWD2_9TELE|nr:PREDICTED: low affinity vacuolar monovalent cation/H(+) antiporter-like [Stegastes partitus]
MSASSTQSPDTTSRRRRPAEHTQGEPTRGDYSLCENDPQATGYNHEHFHDRLCGVQQLNTTNTCSPSLCPSSYPAVKCVSAHACASHHVCEESWEEIQSKKTIRAENEVEANKLVNNYRFGFRKWKSHVTERPFEDRSEVVKELYSELNVIKPHAGPGQLITCGNVLYVFLFGWWVSLAYLLVGIFMFITIIGVPYGKLCWKLCRYFLWPFGNSIHEIGNTLRRCCEQAPDCDCSLEAMDDSSPVLLPSPTEIPVPEVPGRPVRTPYWRRFSTYVWLLLGYPPLVVVHSLVCFISWILVFTIPVSKMNAQTLGVILLLAPEDVSISSSSRRKHQGYESRALLCCYHAANWYYYKYGICMIIGGLRHSEQRFNSRCTGVSSALLFISVGGVFAPTLFSKAYGNLVCDACTNSTGGNSTSNSSGPFVCHNCHYDLNNGTLFHNHVQ